MATPVIMPKQGQSVESCIISKWFKKAGDSVSAGDILFSYETDKAAFDLESPADGTLLVIFFPEGSEVPVLGNVAVIGVEGENPESFRPGTVRPVKVEIRQTATEAGEVSQIPVVTENQARVNEGRIRISPRAKKMAAARGLRYAGITGSGPNGRIIVRDIKSGEAGMIKETRSTVIPGAEFSEQPLSNVRKLIAKAMHSSLQNSAQLTHHMSADVRKLLDARRRVKDGIKSDTVKQDITLNDMICWCVIRALQKFPEMNSHLLADRLRNFNEVHLGIAVDTPRGLLVPALRNAGRMDLVTLSRELKSLAGSCRKGNVSPELIQSTSASFTVSNLGNYGVEMFTPVINLPQAGILGVCTIINRPADIGNNTFGFVPYIGLSLTYDHRAIDGGPATLFLKEIKDQIENFNY